MPRKSRSYDKHTPLPDPKYGSVKYAKFINYLMERGKKNIARKILYDALGIVTEKMGSGNNPSPQNNLSVPAGHLSSKGEKTAEQGKAKGPSPLVRGEEGREVAVKADAPKPEKKLDGRTVFDQALKNVSPIMEIKGRRIGGSNYQVPMEVQEPRRTALGMKWLIAAAAAKKGQRMAEKLAAEIMDAYNKTGAAIKKREDVHRMAEANKAFAHFARFNRR